MEERSHIGGQGSQWRTGVIIEDRGGSGGQESILEDRRGQERRGDRHLGQVGVLYGES